MLVSTRQRLGEPLVVACGSARAESGLQVGLLFVAPNAREERITLAGGADRITVSLPEAYLSLSEPQWFTNVLLEEAK